MAVDPAAAEIQDAVIPRRPLAQIIQVAVVAVVLGLDQTVELEVPV